MWDIAKRGHVQGTVCLNTLALFTKRLAEMTPIESKLPAQQRRRDSRL